MSALCAFSLNLVVMGCKRVGHPTTGAVRKLTKAFCALRLYLAAFESNVQASRSSFIALAAIGDRGPRVTIVLNTT